MQRFGTTYTLKREHGTLIFEHYSNDSSTRRHLCSLLMKNYEFFIFGFCKVVRIFLGVYIYLYFNESIFH